MAINRPLKAPSAAQLIADERSRVVAILAAGAHHPELAKKLIFNGASVEQARDLLASVPAANPYLAALEKEGAADISGFLAGDVFKSADPKEARKAELAAAAKSYSQGIGYSVKA